MRAADLPLSPTFIAFTPWTTAEGYHELLRGLADLGLAEQVAPIQLAIRLLIPEGSLLLDLPEVRAMIGAFDERALCYPWRNPDPAMDTLCLRIQEKIKRAERAARPRAEIFREICELANAGEYPDAPMEARVTIPYLTEPWYC
jgi:hypothetical protein